MKIEKKFNRKVINIAGANGLNLPRDIVDNLSINQNSAMEIKEHDKDNKTIKMKFHEDGSNLNLGKQYCRSITKFSGETYFISLPKYVLNDMDVDSGNKIELDGDLDKKEINLRFFPKIDENEEVE